MFPFYYYYYYYYFGPEACGILLLHPEMEQAKKRWSLGNWNSAEKSELEIYYSGFGESYKRGDCQIKDRFAIKRDCDNGGKKQNHILRNNNGKGNGGKIREAGSM